MTVGRDRREGVATLRLGPVDADTARLQLAELVELRTQGMCAPLPLAVKTSAEYAAKRVNATAANATALAEKERASDRYEAEQADIAHRLVWGDPAPFDVLIAEKATDNEQPVGWLGDEPHRFGALTRRLWEPLLAAEALT